MPRPAAMCQSILHQLTTSSANTAGACTQQPRSGDAIGVRHIVLGQATSWWHKSARQDYSCLPISCASSCAKAVCAAALSCALMLRVPPAVDAIIKGVQSRAAKTQARSVDWLAVFDGLLTTTPCLYCKQEFNMGPACYILTGNASATFQGCRPCNEAQRGCWH